MKRNFIILFSALTFASVALTNALACGCGCKGNNCGGGVTQQSTTTDVQEQKVQCPVMKNWILPSEAADLVEYNGKTYYFCCGGCKEKFLAEPEKYVSDETKSYGVL